MTTTMKQLERANPRNVKKLVEAALTDGFTREQLQQVGNAHVRSLARKIMSDNGRLLSVRANLRRQEAAKYPVGTRIGALLCPVSRDGVVLQLDGRNAKIEVELHGPEGALVLAIEAPNAGGYARMSANAFGSLYHRGGAFSVWLCTERSCASTSSLGEYKLVREVA